MHTKSVELSSTSEILVMYSQTTDRLRALFVDTFGEEETVTGSDGAPVKVSELLKESESFDNLTKSID